MTNRIILLLWAFLSAFACLGETTHTSAFTFTEEHDLAIIGEYCQIFEDPTAELEVDAAMEAFKNDGAEPLGKKVFSHPSSASAFWFKFSIANTSGNPIWMILGDAFSLWNADLYCIDDNGAIKQIAKLGTLRPEENNILSRNTISTLLDQGENPVPQTYYLRIEGHTPKLNVFQVGTLKAIVSHTERANNIAYLFLGLSLAMAIYNLFLYFSTKAKIYLLYILYLIDISFTIPFNVGYSFFHYDFIWEALLGWHNVWFFLTAIFSVAYLDLKSKLPIAYKAVVLMTIIVSVIIPILNIFHIVHMAILAQFFQPLALLFYLLLLASGVYLWKKGFKNARFYVLGWVFLMISVTVFVLTINDFLPYNWFSHHILYFGFGMEAVLFGLALGDRLNTLKKEKESSQAEVLSLITSQNETLEKKVADKTSALKNANNELLVSNEELKQQQDELAAQRDFLEEQAQTINAAYANLEQKNLIVNTSIKAAKDIQKAILPTTASLAAIFPQYFLLFKPKDVVSGDFYWVHRTEGITLFIEADCTGHGVPGAFMTLVGSAIFDQIIRLEGELDPATIINKTHQKLVENLHQKTTNNKNGMDLSVIALREEEQQVHITFESAGQRLYFTQGNEIKQLDGTRKKVGGIYESKRTFENKHLTLAKGETLYLSSDGFADQNNVDRKSFRYSQFKALLQSIHSLSMEEQQNALEEALKNHQGEAPQRDDITVVGIRV